MSRKPINTATLSGVVLDHLPMPVMVVDEQRDVFGLNSEAARFLGERAEVALARKSGEVLGCLNDAKGPGLCGSNEACNECEIRQAVDAVRSGVAVNRIRTDMILVKGKHEELVTFLVSAGPLVVEDQELIMIVLEDVTELVTLRDLVPICASCKKIRSEDGSWQSVEKYLGRQVQMNFTHGICPGCEEQLYPREGR